MSNYRRLISYIYAYEGGVKGKNIGYAKVEVRGDQCRIQVNVKKVYVGSNDIGVYLLSPGAEIMLGKIFIRGGAGEFRVSVQSGDVEGSGYSMDQCYGLTVHDVESTWQCYTTIWEDAVTQAAEVQVQAVEVQAAEQSTGEPRAEAAGRGVSDVTEKAAELELADVTAENVRVWETAEEAQNPPEETMAQSRLPVSEEIERELSAEELRLSMVAPWDPEPVEETVEEAAEEAAEEEPIPEPGDPAQLAALDRMEKEAASQNHLWDQLGRRYPKVLAFDYDNGCEILSIHPQDIGLLPREIWVYGNNSFLLHGYYNYRHLILAKLNNPKGRPRYLLGVPGHYFSNEKYMASMFGFPHFVLAKRQPETDGRFGYWYTDVRL